MAPLKFGAYLYVGHRRRAGVPRNISVSIDNPARYVGRRRCSMRRGRSCAGDPVPLFEIVNECLIHERRSCDTANANECIECRCKGGELEIDHCVKSGGQGFDRKDLGLARVPIFVPKLYKSPPSTSHPARFFSSVTLASC